MKPSILVTKRIYPQAVDLLRDRAELDYVETDDGLESPALIARSRGCQAIVSQLTDTLDGAVIEALDKSVRAIANVAVGFDNIDVKAATRRGILVTNTPDVLTETTADFAWALMMAAARRLPEGQTYLQAGKWTTWTIDLLVGHDIHGKTLGVMGMGRIGQAFARRSLGFNMRLLYTDAHRLSRDIEKEFRAEFVGKEQLLQESDFVSLHVPYLPSTHHLIGARELKQMKRTAVLVNTSRGSVVNEAELAEALAQGWIAAAGLDVFEDEPQVHAKLLELDNVVLTPHIASASIDTRRQMSIMAAENALAGATGAKPSNLVNLEAWEVRSAHASAD